MGWLDPDEPNNDALYKALRQGEDFVRNDEISVTRTAGAMVNEFVKSYGFRRDASSGQWSWSLGNIAKAFEEDPIFTTLDYLSWTVAPARFGLAAFNIARGAKYAGAIGKGFQALNRADEFGNVARAALQGKKAETLVGRAFEALGGSSELAAATEMKLKGPSVLHGLSAPTRKLQERFRGKTLGLASPVTTELSDDYIKLVDKFGGEVWENRAVAKVAERERLLEEGVFTKEAQTIAGQWAASGADDRMKRLSAQMLSYGMKPGGAAAKKVFGENALAAKAYENTWNYRNFIHEESYKLGLISKETYEKNLNRYNPRLYEEWFKIQKEQGALTKSTKVLGEKIESAESAFESAKTMRMGGEGRYAARQGDGPEYLTRILDPTVSLGALAQAGQVIARQRYAQGLAQSVLAKSSDEIGDFVKRVLDMNDVDGALLHGITSDKIAGLRRLMSDYTDVNRRVRGEEAAEVLGWKKIDSLFDKAKVPEYVKNLPEDFKNKWIDPLVQADIKGTFEVLGNENFFKDFYKGMVRTFQASKTAYNPGTVMRNIFGAAVNNHLAAGGQPFRLPMRGRAAIKEQGEEFMAMVKAGIFGSSFDAEIHDALRHGKAITTERTALDWLPDNVVGGAMKKGAGYAERFYRSIDETFKADAWLRIVDKHKGRVGLEKARDLATIEVNKFMPNFQMHSDLTGAAKGAIPFVSFTSEALRTWTNVLKEKPYLAFFYNHTFESMSQAFAATAGVSAAQIEEAKQALPEYTQGRKMMVLPVRVDGQPRFLDLSYMIPLGSIADLGQAEGSFLSLVNPTTNPVLNLTAAGVTGKDPFTGNEIAPNFTERQLGVPVDNARARHWLGMAEHTARMFTPPWAPPGFAATNMLESVRGQVNPATGEDLEQGVLRTMLANFAGFRTYAADVESQIKNVKAEERRLGERLKSSWDRWEFARANGDVEAMETEHQRILAIRSLGGDDDPESYFANAIPGKDPFVTLSRATLEKVLDRAQNAGPLSPKDERIRAELVVRYQKARRNQRRRRRRLATIDDDGD